MKEPIVHAASAPLVRCPSCGADFRPQAERLLDGSTLPCPSCGAASVLIREWSGHPGAAIWELVEPGDDEEP